MRINALCPIRFVLFICRLNGRRYPDLIWVHFSEFMIDVS